MDTTYKSFADFATFHEKLIQKGIDAVPVADFVQPYREHYGSIKIVSPGLTWQQCQYDGTACIGIFRVFTYVGEVVTQTHIAVVGNSISSVTHLASLWFHKNRQRGDIVKPTVSVSEHRSVYPVLIPENSEEYV